MPPPAWFRASSTGRALATTALASAFLLALACDGSPRPEAWRSPGAPRDARPSEPSRPRRVSPPPSDDPLGPPPRALAAIPRDAALPPDRAPAAVDDEDAPAEEDDLAQLEAALADPDPALRRQAVLEVLPRPEAEPLLLVALRDPDPGVRAAVADDLAFLESDRARSGVLWALRDADPSVVVAAIDALEMVAAPGDVDALRPLATTGEPSVRERAAAVLARLDRTVLADVEAGEERNHGEAAAVEGSVR